MQAAKATPSSATNTAALRLMRATWVMTAVDRTRGEEQSGETPMIACGSERGTLADSHGQSYDFKRNLRLFEEANAAARLN